MPTWIGSARSNASRPLSVRCAYVARRSVAGTSRRTSPASSMRAIRRVTPPRESSRLSASSPMRLHDSGAHVSCASTSNHDSGSPASVSSSALMRSSRRVLACSIAYQARNGFFCQGSP